MLGCLMILIMKAAERGEAMTADLRYALASSIDLHRRQRRIKLFHRSLAILIVTAGIVNQSAELPPAAGHLLRMDLLPVFGALLMGLVVSRIYWYVSMSPPACPLDIRQFTRHLSRTVYLLLYVVIFAKEIVDLGNATWHHGTFDFEMLAAYLRMPVEQVSAGFKEEFRGYVVCGVSAIVIIRLWAALHRKGARFTQV